MLHLFCVSHFSQEAEKRPCEEENNFKVKKEKVMQCCLIILVLLFLTAQELIHFPSVTGSPKCLADEPQQANSSREKKERKQFTSPLEGRMFRQKKTFYKTETSRLSCCG